MKQKEIKILEKQLHEERNKDEPDGNLIDEIKRKLNYVLEERQHELGIKHWNRIIYN